MVRLIHIARFPIVEADASRLAWPPLVLIAPVPHGIVFAEYPQRPKQPANRAAGFAKTADTEWIDLKSHSRLTQPGILPSVIAGTCDPGRPDIQSPGEVLTGRRQPHLEPGVPGEDPGVVSRIEELSAAISAVQVGGDAN